MSSNPGDASAGSLPGLDYVLRVGQVWITAMTGQAAMLNELWRQISSGNYELKAAMQNWAKTVESQFAVLVEASRGPGYVREPVWICIDYVYSEQDKKWVPSTLAGTATIPRLEPSSTVLAASPFAALGSQKPIDNLYKPGFPSFDAPNYSKIRVELDPNGITDFGTQKGQYISLITATGRNFESPLAIVLLQVRVLAP